MALIIAKLMDPVIIILAILGGSFSRLLWHLAIVAFVAASLQEALLFSIQLTRRFQLEAFVVGLVAAAIWAGVAFGIKRAIQARRSN